mmetsp:Transcript_75406/g.201522  ORF Transcript_75406/g.201522 Transcript_75406/m.201522 type:complete len:217 (-) Transcript_75406:1288-1938(-)
MRVQNDEDVVCPDAHKNKNSQDLEDAEIGLLEKEPVHKQTREHAGEDHQHREQRQPEAPGAPHQVQQHEGERGNQPTKVADQNRVRVAPLQIQCARLPPDENLQAFVLAGIQDLLPESIQQPSHHLRVPLLHVIIRELVRGVLRVQPRQRGPELKNRPHGDGGLRLLPCLDEEPLVCGNGWEVGRGFWNQSGSDVALEGDGGPLRQVWGVLAAGSR